MGTSKEKGNRDGTAGSKSVTELEQLEKPTEMQVQQNSAPMETKPFLEREIVIKIEYWLCLCLLVMAFLFGVMVVMLFLAFGGDNKPDVKGMMREVQDRAGSTSVDLFRNYDFNRDGFLSILEFEPLIPHFKDMEKLVNEVIFFFLSYAVQI